MKRLLYSLLLLPGLLSAQTESQLLPTELKKQTIITQPVTLYKGFIRAGFAYNYLFIDKIFDEDRNRESIANSFGDIWTVVATFQYGVTDRLQLSLNIPYTDRNLSLSIRQEAPGFGIFEEVSFDQSGRGFSDIDLSGTYQLITETENRPAFTVTAVVFLPTGEKDIEVVNDDEVELPVGSGRFASELRLNIRKANYPFLFSAFVGYKYNFEGSKVLDPGDVATDFQDGGLFNTSGLVGYHVNEWMAIINEVSFSRVGKNEVAGQTIDENAKWTLDYLPRLSFQINRLRINQLISFPIIGRSSGADPGITAIVQYVF